MFNESTGALGAVAQQNFALRQALLARGPHALWVDHTGYFTPHDDPTITASGWGDWFRRAGQHEVHVSGYLEDVLNENGEVVTVEHADIDRIARQDLTPPPHLYRASVPGFADRWCWFDRFDMAKLICDDRRGDYRIYTCDPGEVFGVVRMDRTEPHGHRELWNEWIVKPENVREINRWRDPYAEVKNLEAWQGQGVHAVEASSVVGSWFRSTTSKVAPMDRQEGSYWLLQFKRIGQFVATSFWDAAEMSKPQQNEVLPAVDLQAPKRLYRGSPEALKGRWSWTAEPDTAKWFIKMFCPDEGKIWVCEPATVFGVINAQIANPQPPYMMEKFTEWIVLPDESTIREWDGK